MTRIRKVIKGMVGGIVLALFVYAAHWGIGQRAHGKEYWLIFAHIIPFILLVLLGAGLALFIAHWCVRDVIRQTIRFTE